MYVGTHCTPHVYIITHVWTLVGTCTPYHICVHMLPHTHKGAPHQLHMGTRHHTCTLPFIRHTGVLYWARAPRQVRTCHHAHAHHTCAHHTHTLLGTHVQCQAGTYIARHTTTHMFTCRHTHHHSGQAATRRRPEPRGFRGLHLEAVTDPPGTRGSHSRAPTQAGLSLSRGSWLFTAYSVPGALVSLGLTLSVCLTVSCSRPQAEGFSQEGLEASRANLWAK